MLVHKNVYDLAIKWVKKLYKKKQFRCVKCNEILPFLIKYWDEYAYVRLYIECPKCREKNTLHEILLRQFHIGTYA
jgi:phage FluMu protein Com